MDIKAKVINDVLIGMNRHIEGNKVEILKAVLQRVLTDITLTANETALSTQMDQNVYIMQMYETRKKNKISIKTYNFYMDTMHHLIDFTGKSLLYTDEFDIDDYLNYYESKGNSAVTVNNERRNISAFFGWMRKCKMIMFNPCDNVETRKTIEKPIEYLKGYEIEELRDGCVTLRDRALLELLRSTGVRVGEAVLINREDVDYANGDVLIFAPKTGQYRTVFLDDTARYHLKKYVESRMDDNNALFVGIRKTSTRTKPEGIRYVMKKIAKKVDMNRRIYPHLMRKTLATTMNLHNCPQSIIQATLGHKAGSPVTAKHYAATTTEQLRAAHSQYVA